jgi:hypothetical protein
VDYFGFLHMNSNQCVKVQAKISPRIFKLENAGQKRFDRCFGREEGGGKAKRTGKRRWES